MWSWGPLTHMIDQLKVTTVYILFPCASSSGKGEEMREREQIQLYLSVTLYRATYPTYKQQAWLKSYTC